MKTLAKLSVSFLLVVALFHIIGRAQRDSILDERKLIVKLYKNEKDNDMVSNYEKQGLMFAIYKFILIVLLSATIYSYAIELLRIEERLQGIENSTIDECRSLSLIFSQILFWILGKMVTKVR